MKTVGLLFALILAPQKQDAQPMLTVGGPFGPNVIPNFRPGPMFPTSNEGTPQFQTYVVKGRDGGESRGITVHVPRDRDGNRYFYSFTQGGKLGTTFEPDTTVESWLDPVGRPLRTRYQFVTPSLRKEVDATMRMEQGRLKVFLVQTETKKDEKPIRKSRALPVSNTDLLQFTSYAPSDIAIDDDGRAYFFSLDFVNPVGAMGESTWFERKLDARKGTYVYRITTMSSWREIEMNRQGQIVRTADKFGTVSTAAEPLAEEKQTIAKILAAATGQSAKAATEAVEKS